MPDLSKMAGDQKASADMTTNRVAFATYTVQSTDGLSVRSLVYTTPVARPSLSSNFIDGTSTQERK